MNMKMVQRLGLTTHLTPQLIVLMRLMALPTFELRQEIAKALEENPLLEENNTADDTDALALDDHARLLEYLFGGPPGRPGWATEEVLEQSRSVIQRARIL